MEPATEVVEAPEGEAELITTEAPTEAIEPPTAEPVEVSKVEEIAATEEESLEVVAKVVEPTEDIPTLVEAELHQII